MLSRFVSSVDIHPLILDTISKHCEDERIKNVIVHLLSEVLEYQNLHIDYDSMSFKKRYKELVLANFKEELEDE